MSSHSRQKAYKKPERMSGQAHDVIKCAKRLAKIHFAGMIESNKPVPDSELIQKCIIEMHEGLNKLVEYVRALEDTELDDDSRN
jgi:hypothetical protein